MIDPNHLHPMIVHFPIALVIIGFLSDVIGLLTKRKFFASAGLYLIILGTAGTVAAYLTGGLAGDGIEEAGALGAALHTHESAALLAIWTMVILASLRTTLAITRRMTGWLQWVMVILLAFGVGTVARTGYYGGNLVYQHAAGVQLTLGTIETQSTVSPEPVLPSNASEDID